MPSTGRTLFLVASLLACGCDYPIFLFVPDVDSGGDDGAIALDGSTDARPTDSSSSEGGIDARTDAAGDTVVGDARSDTTVADAPSDTPTDVLVTKGCAGSVHVFCADFDAVLTPESGWTDTNLVGGGSNLLDRAVFTSPSASYVARIPASALSEAGASLNEDFSLASPTPLLRAELLVRLDAATYAQETLLVKIAIGPSGLVMNIVGTPSSGSFPLLVTKPNVWLRLKLEVVLATGTGGSAKAYVDDKLLATQTGVATTTSTASNARMVVGLYQFSTPIAAVTANFDDVTFDTL